MLVFDTIGHSEWRSVEKERMGKLACEEAVEVTGYMLLWCSVWNYSIVVVMEKKTFKCVGQSWGMFPMGETVRQWKWNSHSGSGLLRGLFVKERVQSGQIFIEYLGTNSMIVDPLTKGLSPKVFHEHVAHMGVLEFEESLV